MFILELVGGKIGEKLAESFVENHLKEWIKRLETPVNHDLQRAIRRGVINATLIFLTEYTKKQKKGFFTFGNKEENFLKLKKYLKTERKKTEKDDYTPSLNTFMVDIPDLVKPDALNAMRWKMKMALLSELADNGIEIPEDFAGHIKYGITIDGQKVDWYELVSSFFVESVKTNQRIKAALDNDFFVRINEQLEKQGSDLRINFDQLSQSITQSNKIIVGKIDHIDDKLDMISIQITDALKNAGVESEPVQIREQKIKINEKIARLNQIVNQIKNTGQNTTNLSGNESLISDREWKLLTKSIQKGECVLFIGQEIAVDEDGKSIHENFYKTVVEDFDEIDYFEKDDFFSPFDDVFFLQEIQDFYEEKFPALNKKGEEILKKMAQFPFSLIISLTPDDTMHRIYECCMLVQ